MNGGLEWRPNPGVQEWILRVPSSCFELLFGGSRGGGKTSAGIMWLIKSPAELKGKSLMQHPQYRALVLRRNSNDLTDWIDRAYNIYRHFGATLVKHPQATFTFPSGAKIYTGHLKDADSYTKYQGAEFCRILIEELTHIKSELLYTKLLGSCRSTIPELKPQVFLSTNPGGPGHQWVRDRFINPAPPKTFFTNPKTGRPAIYVPATVDDNPKLAEANPEYVAWLDALKETDENLYKAWRYGSWEVREGSMFREFRYDKHVISDMSWINFKTCRRIAALDWGWAHATSVHWLALLPANEYGVQHIVIYREAYKNQTTALQWAQLLASINKIDPVEYLVLPHDCFSTRPDGQTIAQVFRQQEGMARIKQAESLKQGMKMNRISLMHQALADSPDGLPYLLIHESCRDLIRTIPDLEYDDINPEMIDSNAENDAFDSATYGLYALRPQFGSSIGQLVQINPNRARLAPELLQTPDGQIIPGDLLAAAAQPASVYRMDAEA